MNTDLAKIFQEMALLMEMKGVQFKPRAFEKAAASLEAAATDVNDLYKKGGIKALEEIPGIGAGLAERIEEYIKTGHIKEYDTLKKKMPVNLEDLSSVEGIGPKMILKLYKKLHIKDRSMLEKAVKAGKLRGLKGFGEKTEQNIIKNIDFLKQSHGRYPIGQVYPLVQKMLTELRAVKGVIRAEAAGSFRRMQETVGDIDILVIAEHHEPATKAFVSLPEVSAVHSMGETRSSVRLTIGIDADLRVIAPESFGAALQYFTGDKFHNVAVRQIAIALGYKLNEYGLYKGATRIAGQTEEDIYQKLGMACPVPELRTNHGEIDAALKKQLPHVIGYDDMKGDLQVHTDWSDGKNTIVHMCEAAKKFGYEYICISDHTKSLAMTGGADEKKLLKQMAEIDVTQKKISSFKILKGAEVNIMKDGTLDIEDEVLAKLDICGAAVHSNFNLSEKDMTDRIIRAMENPHVDIIYHPTGRLIGQREAYKLDVARIIAAAKRTGTILEIDGNPYRLDLKDEHARQVIEAGVKLAIDTDAHAPEHFDFMRFGIGQARRGWVTKHDVINTRSWQDLLKLLK